MNIRLNLPSDLVALSQAVGKMNVSESSPSDMTCLLSIVKFDFSRYL